MKKKFDLFVNGDIDVADLISIPAAVEISAMVPLEDVDTTHGIFIKGDLYLPGIVAVSGSIGCSGFLSAKRSLKQDAEELEDVYLVNDATHQRIKYIRREWDPRFKLAMVYGDSIVSTDGDVYIFYPTEVSSDNPCRFIYVLQENKMKDYAQMIGGYAFSFGYVVISTKQKVADRGGAPSSARIMRPPTQREQ
ncbi:MAG: hypothetical protein K2G53_01280 [Muribaculaceae bacterium]|nr:hypothetical protein [Muribaculaceae bacterium]